MQNCLCFLKNGKTTIVTATADGIYWILVVLVLAGPECRLEVLVGAVPELKLLVAVDLLGFCLYLVGRRMTQAQMKVMPKPRNPN
jgi:hypothetical protein